MSTYLDEHRTQDSRQVIYDRFETWDRQGLLKVNMANKTAHLIFLLGKNNINDLLYKMTAEDEHLIKLLAGPYGWTVYKMLEAKRHVKFIPKI